MSMTDEQLMKAFVDWGDEYAFDELFEKHRVPLTRYLKKRTSDWQLAEDVVQLTFIKAFYNKDKYDPDYRVGTWLYTIAKNILTDQQRKNKETTTRTDLRLRWFWAGLPLVEGEAKFLGVSTKPQEPHVELERQESIDQLTEALEVLTPEQREAIDKVYFEGKTLREAGDEIGVSYETVRQRTMQGQAAMLGAM